MSVLILSSVRVAVEGGEESGLLVLRDDVLVAILVCLEDPMYGPDAGRWNLEAGFGICAIRHDTFTTLEEALRWVAGRLKLDVDPAVASALAALGPFGTCG